MPKLTGPLHSDSATGQIGKKIIFQNRQGQAIAKNYAVPRNRQSPAQTATRNFTKYLMQRWKTLPLEIQATWDAYAKDMAVSPINAYFSENWLRHNLGQALIDTCDGLLALLIDNIPDAVDIRYWAIASGDPSSSLSITNHQLLINNPQTLTSLDNNQQKLDAATVDFTHCTALTWIQLQNSNLLTAPRIAFLPNLNTIDFSANPFTEPPDISGCTGLQSLTLTDNAMADLSAIDDLINLLHATTLMDNGYLYLYDGTNAVRTAASDDAFNALQNRGWTIETN